MDFIFCLSISASQRRIGTLSDCTSLVLPTTPSSLSVHPRTSPELLEPSRAAAQRHVGQVPGSSTNHSSCLACMLSTPDPSLQAAALLFHQRPSIFHSVSSAGDVSLLLNHDLLFSTQQQVLVISSELQPFPLLSFFLTGLQTLPCVRMLQSHQYRPQIRAERSHMGLQLRSGGRFHPHFQCDTRFLRRRWRGMVSRSHPYPRHPLRVTSRHASYGW
ncbi:uncharacterized protein LOC116732784 [Xiphophorus hellerii]|uniref:uncharacterized protein LOC116732784 n=1 Tax=Xiphophorus hellerii TaxID=8084 RepID=UPI0013B3820B|nr:uncharacterized protein LOC116732784 [Xiphophorus hellerii]